MKIKTSGWIENEMEKFFMALERLFQNEIDKFIGSMQIMRDYYHNLDNRPLIELPFTTIDIIKEELILYLLKNLMKTIIIILKKIKKKRMMKIIIIMKKNYHLKNK